MLDRNTGAIIVLLSICAIGFPDWAGAAGPDVPTVPVESLSGKQITIPADLPKVPCLFVIGFSKGSSSQTEEWSRRLEGRFPSDSVAIYSVSVLEDVPKLLRGFIVRGIRRSVPENLHDRFLIVTKQAEAWKTLASYSEPDAAYVVLTDKDQEVVWRTSGPVMEAEVKVLDEQVRAMEKRGSYR